MKSHLSLDTVTSLLMCVPPTPDCTHQLEEAVQGLSDEDIATLVQQYLNVSGCVTGYSSSMCI